MNKQILMVQQIIATIDKLLNIMLNAILHHPKHQKLEATWRGLSNLCNQSVKSEQSYIKIKILDISWQEICRDLTKAIEFDQSQLFHKIYSQEFDLPGGEPFTLLAGDYQLSLSSPTRTIASDISILQEIGKIAAAAFSPFIMATHPSLFGIVDFTHLSVTLDLPLIFQQREYQDWKKLRHDPDARFLGLVLPSVLKRLPYEALNNYQQGFIFKEEIKGKQDYLWGNAIYCFASLIVKAANEKGWFTELCHRTNPSTDEGLVTNLPRIKTSYMGNALLNNYATEVGITDNEERTLCNLGFIALCENKYKAAAAFYSCPSIQIPASYELSAANDNAKLSTLLPYILSMSRFVHYLKIIARTQLGKFTTLEDCEHKLQNWLLQYTAARSELSKSARTKYPLKSAKVFIESHLEGNYRCIIHLCPHYQFDSIEANIIFTTEILGK